MIGKELTLQDLNEEIKPYLGTLVLMDFTVVRLIGATEDEDGIYYETSTLTNSVIKWSALMYFTPLKGFVNEQRYQNLVRMFNISSMEKAI